MGRTSEGKSRQHGLKKRAGLELAFTQAKAGNARLFSTATGTLVPHCLTSPAAHGAGRSHARVSRSRAVPTSPPSAWASQPRSHLRSEREAQALPAAFVQS